MSQKYSPEFAKAIEPFAPMLAAAPRPKAGDATGARDALYPSLVGVNERAPDTPNVSHKEYHSESKDGHQIPIWHFFTTDGSRAPNQKEGKTSAVLYFHGGGMIMGELKHFTKQAAALTAESGVPFFAVGYRLAPEDPFPTPQEDCFAALEWLRAHADELGVDVARIGVYGESGGGGLAAALALMARDRGVSPPLAKQVLIYPMLDDRNTIPNPEIEPLAWSYDLNATGWGALLGDQVGREGVSYYAAPARAEDLRGLPSTYLDVGTQDIFRDEDLSYVQKLVKGGVYVEFHLWPGMTHWYDNFAPEAGDTKRARAAWIRAIQSF